MKHRIRKTLSLALALIMLLSMVPLVYAAEDVDEFAGLETLEEIPFEFVLEPGDLPYELLREAVLDVRDIPDCIDPALAEERGHVNRLYLQEPDDNTVMFQNRDGSKTIYLFSHPVKGMTASTVATVQINGTSVSFSGENAITSRLAEITNFNIGSAEIAYLPVGVLSENGVNITEDVRNWTLAESIDVVQAYNISSEAAAEYAASVAVPETDAAATAAAAPGITITPNDPAPLGGMTVMSISYSDLAGVMRFKNVSTNKYLTFSNSSLTVSTSFQLKYSEWVVQYDSFFGYVVSNLSDPYNTYIGYDDTETFMIDTLSYMMYAIEPVIVSTSASTVRLQCSLSAIDSNAQMYELSPDESDYPDSCTWQIMNKRNVRLVTSISVPNTTVIKQSGVGSIYTDNYSFERPFPTYYEIEIYDATTNQPFVFDSKIYEDDEYWCTINTPGIYTAYYKDNITKIKSPNFTIKVVNYVTGITVPSSVRIEQHGVGFTLDYEYEPDDATPVSVSLYYADTNTEVPHIGDTYTIPTPGIYTVYYKDSESGVRSENFTLIIVESLTTYAPKNTYSITPAVIPAGSNPLYLTRNASGTLILQAKSLTSSTVTRRGGVSGTIMYQDIQNFSRTFTFVYEDDSLGMEAGVCMAATRSTSQYTGMPQGLLIDEPNGRPIPDYTLTYTDDNGYAVDYNINNYDLEEKSSDTPFWVCDMGGYYLIISDIFYDNNGDIVIMALKSNGADQEVTISELTDSDNFKWNVFFVGIDVPVIKQTHKKWCGPTSYLQVLYGANLQDNVPGETLNAQQGYIRNDFHGGYESATTLDEYAKDINDSGFLPAGYICKEVNPTSSKTQAQLREYITSSLADGMACIFFTVTGNSTANKTNSGPYKYSYDWENATDPFGHLECIIGYDPLTDTVIINNCHYMDNRIGLGEIRLSDLCIDMERLWYFEDTNN